MSPATGPEVGPSMAGLIEQAAAALDNAARPLLAQAVRQLADHNRDLNAHTAELAALLETALATGTTYGRMYALAAENTDHHRDTLRRIANATDIHTARQIAAEALK